MNDVTKRPAPPRIRFQKKFIEDFLADWEENGAGAIKILRIEKPHEYCRIAASILPREIDIEGGEQLVINVVRFADQQIADDPVKVIEDSECPE
jgi:hypothetical protein